MIKRLEAPQGRQGEFVIELFERYKRMTGDFEEAILEMYLSGISMRKVARLTDDLSRVRVGKDALSRITFRLKGQQRDWGSARSTGRLTLTATLTLLI